MPSFDYDVAIIGSGFGGSVAALRAAEKGHRVGVMEAGRRWKDEDIPKTQWDLPRFLWQPEAEQPWARRRDPERLRRSVLPRRPEATGLDLTTGAAVEGPATKPLKTYEVRELEGRIQIRV